MFMSSLENTFKTKFYEELVPAIRKHRNYENYFNHQAEFEADESISEYEKKWFRTIKMLLEFKYDSEFQFEMACKNAEFILDMLNF
jgi:hypothetical protein